MTSTPELEAGLVDLAPALDAPSGDGIARAVVSRLSADQGAGGVVRNAGVRRWLVGSGAAVVAVVGSFVAGPAVADWFGVRGVEVRRPDQAATTLPPTTGTVPSDGASLDLGTAMPSLAAAEAAAGFAAAVPSALGTPDAIWVDRRGAAPFISLVYEGGPLLTEFDATIIDDAILSKMAGPDTIIEQLRIQGEPAMWIDGVHQVAVRARNGEPVFERLRLSDKVLLVQHGALTVRIEMPPGLGRDDAVRIAESLPR